MGGVKLYPLWKEAVKTFIEAGMFAPGTVITAQWKKENFGIKQPVRVEEVQDYQLKMLSAFESFENELLTEHQIHLKAAGKGSHIVLAPNEQTKESWNDGLAKIKSAFRKMDLRLSNVDVAALTADERKENTDALVRLAAMKTMNKKARRLAIE